MQIKLITVSLPSLVFAVYWSFSTLVVATFLCRLTGRDFNKDWFSKAEWVSSHSDGLWASWWATACSNSKCLRACGVMNSVDSVCVINLIARGERQKLCTTGSGIHWNLPPERWIATDEKGRFVRNDEEECTIPQVNTWNSRYAILDKLRKKTVHQCHRMTVSPRKMANGGCVVNPAGTEQLKHSSRAKSVVLCSAGFRQLWKLE